MYEERSPVINPVLSLEKLYKPYAFRNEEDHM